MERMKLIMAASIALLGCLCLSARADLLVHYTFDEASSGTTNAINTGTLGSTFDGTFNGTATRTTDTPNSATTAALNLNGGGTNDVGPGAGGDVNPLSAITVSMWMNVQSQVATTSQLYVQASDFTFGNHGWLFYYNPGTVANTQSLGLEADTAAVNASTAVDAYQTWLFIAVTWDATTGDLDFYTGSPSGGVTLLDSTMMPSSITDASGALLRVGGYSSNTNTAPDALVDDFRVYNTVLSSSDLESVRLEELPEPASLGLLTAGGLMLLRRRRA